jgi:nucleotide-binding universal stress UspA family protein
MTDRPREANMFNIAMGSRGLSDVGGILLGSVTHKVLHLAECPVLVVR